MDKINFASCRNTKINNFGDLTFSAIIHIIIHKTKNTVETFFAIFRFFFNFELYVASYISLVITLVDV